MYAKSVDTGIMLLKYFLTKLYVTGTEKNRQDHRRVGCEMKTIISNINGPAQENMVGIIIPIL